MPEPDGQLRPDPDPPAPPLTGPAAVAARADDETLGPDRALEHTLLYATVLGILVGGSYLLRDNIVYESGYTAHSIMEAVATVLAFIVGALALVRYYSRKQITFLLIGCGFLGAGLLDLNHTLRTVQGYLDALVQYQDANPASIFFWSWTAERVFLSLFLFGSLLAWRQEVRGDGSDVIPEGSVYVIAFFMTITNLLFFELIPLGVLSNPAWVVPRPPEIFPAVLFLLAFIGFYRKGSWRRDRFEHWLLLSLLLAILAHAGFMAFSLHPFDAMFDAAHLLKITSYVAILTGLLSSVHETFRREANVLAALTREVEERSRTERAVKESSHRLQAFLDNASDLIQSVDHEGRILYVNSSWKRILGYLDEDLERFTIFDVVHPAHRAAFDHELTRVLAGGDPKRYPVEYVAADGRIVILSGSTQAVVKDDRPVATQSILRDVTEQRLAERRLEESQQKLEALVENTGDSIWSVDREHKLLTLNSAFSLAMEARTGSEPVVGQGPDEVFPEGDRPWYEELYNRTLAGERHVALRTDYVDGQLRYFELYANPIHSLEGVSGAVFFGKDVTERVRAQEGLRVAKEEADAANKAKSDFLANMSHELRTPLNSVIGFTNILLKNKDQRLNEKDIGFLQRVLSNGKHLLALINEVLDLAKVEAGRMELIIEEVDLAHLCVETVQQLEGQAKSKEGRVELIADVPEEVATVETDSAKLKQVIINLVGNALKFTEQGSVTVRLDVAADGKTPVAISVVDTGIGIPQNRLEAIFEAFQQAEAGTSRRFGGTGLGLALSRSICILMGYDLIVESEMEMGSTFKIVLGERAERAGRPEDGDEDAEAEGETSPSEPAVASVDSDGSSTNGAPSWSDFKVLVVDDERDGRDLLVHTLEEFGCRVVTARNGREALQMAREQTPDLMTLDLLMPDMTGAEVLERLKADPDLRGIPVVIVSVIAGESRGELLGAVDLVTKPFEREDLLRVLWRNLGRRRGGRVLIMLGSDSQRRTLAELVEERGLEVIGGGRDGPLDALRRHQPDAAILDAALASWDVVDSLRALRDDRLLTGLPVFVLTNRGMDDEERGVVEELATMHAEPESASSELSRLLDALFPLAPVEEPAE